MADRFCSQCGGRLLPEARFCAQCGHALAGARRTVFPALRIDRWAPLVVLATVVAVGGLAVLLGSRSAAPPNVPPPRAAAAGGGARPPAMPEGHPPVQVPDDVRQAIAKLVEAAKSKPDDVEAWQQLGFVQYRAGQIDQTYLADAQATYAHILERQPENLDALRALGNIAYDRNEAQHAMEFYQRYLKVKPDDLGVQTDLATMLLASEQVDAAVQAYQAILAKDPKFFQAQFNLAIAYRAKGENDKAIAALEQAREVAGDDETRQRVSTLLARLQGAPEPAAAAAGGEAPAGGDLHADVEAIFRGHPIVGPKLDRVEWPEAQHARVVLREFPMSTMPPFARDKFLERIRGGVRDTKGRHQVTGAVEIELVDAATGTVMETVTE